MLEGIHPLLSGELLHHLDDMGHSDAVVIADAHFPAAAVATRLVNLPGATTPDVLRAIRTVVPRAAFLVIRTGETRTYGNAVLRKGVVGHPRP